MHGGLQKAAAPFYLFISEKKSENEKGAEHSKTNSDQSGKIW